MPTFAVIAISYCLVQKWHICGNENQGERLVLKGIVSRVLKKNKIKSDLLKIYVEPYANNRIFPNERINVINMTHI